MKLYLALFAIVALGLQSGCVTGRRSLSPPVPTGPATAVTKGAVHIATVTDDRTFQNKPSDPSVPSIDGDVNSLTPAQKNRMIGRQRGGFGKAMGDIELAGSDTVTSRVQLLVEEGFRRRGYEISSDPSAPTVVNISVKEFWAWMTPGFFTLSFEAKLGTTLTVDDARGRATVSVAGSGLNHGQVAKNGNWLEAFEPAFDKYLENLIRELDRAVAQPSPAVESAAKPAADLFTELKQLDQLRRENILTEEEFQARKKKLLDKN
jgi:uncharacterized lipoprotein YajG